MGRRGSRETAVAACVLWDIIARLARRQGKQRYGALPLVPTRGFGSGGGLGMDQDIAEALAADRVVGITTNGRKTRVPGRSAIWLWTLDGGG